MILEGMESRPYIGVVVMHDGIRIIEQIRIWQEGGNDLRGSVGGLDELRVIGHGERHDISKLAILSGYLSCILFSCIF